eukprot:1147900-Pelagomonas_calceolata.AAC.6
MNALNVSMLLLLQGHNTITGHSVRQVQGKSSHEAPFLQAPCSQVQLVPPSTGFGVLNVGAFTQMLAVHCGAKSPCVVDAH